MRPEGTKCPHADVVDCPLYHGMHVTGPSCFHEKLFEGCAVDHGADYDVLLSALQATNPMLVAECEMMATARAVKEQRWRNRHHNGIH